MTEDGAETDLDLGHYERFVDESLDGQCQRFLRQGLLDGAEPGAARGAISAARYRSSLISPMRSKRRIYAHGGWQDTDVVISEIGGTVGDIESQPYLEAIRQVAVEKGRENVLYIHVPLIVSHPRHRTS